MMRDDYGRAQEREWVGRIGELCESCGEDLAHSGGLCRECARLEALDAHDDEVLGK